MYDVDTIQIGCNERTDVLDGSLPSRSCDLLRCTVDHEDAAIIRDRTRETQVEALGDLVVAQFIRRILTKDTEHFSRLAAALGEYATS